MIWVQKKAERLATGGGLNQLLELIFIVEEIEVIPMPEPLWSTCQRICLKLK